MLTSSVVRPSSGAAAGRHWASALCLLRNAFFVHPRRFPSEEEEQTIPASRRNPPKNTTTDVAAQAVELSAVASRRAPMDQWAAALRATGEVWARVAPRSPRHPPPTGGPAMTPLPARASLECRLWVPALVRLTKERRWLQMLDTMAVVLMVDCSSLSPGGAGRSDEPSPGKVITNAVEEVLLRNKHRALTSTNRVDRWFHPPKHETDPAVFYARRGKEIAGLLIQWWSAMRASRSLTVQQQDTLEVEWHQAVGGVLSALYRCDLMDVAVSCALTLLRGHDAGKRLAPAAFVEHASRVLSQEATEMESTTTVRTPRPEPVLQPTHLEFEPWYHELTCRLARSNRAWDRVSALVSAITSAATSTPSSTDVEATRCGDRIDTTSKTSHDLGYLAPYIAFYQGLLLNRTSSSSNVKETLPLLSASCLPMVCVEAFTGDMPSMAANGSERSNCGGPPVEDRGAIVLLEWLSKRDHGVTAAAANGPSNVVSKHQHNDDDGSFPTDGIMGLPEAALLHATVKQVARRTILRSREGGVQWEASLTLLQLAQSVTVQHLERSRSTIPMFSSSKPTVEEQQVHALMVVPDVRGKPSTASSPLATALKDLLFRDQFDLLTHALMHRAWLPPRCRTWHSRRTMAALEWMGAVVAMKPDKKDVKRRHSQHQESSVVRKRHDVALETASLAKAYLMDRWVSEMRYHGRIDDTAGGWMTALKVLQAAVYWGDESVQAHHGPHVLHRRGGLVSSSDEDVPGWLDVLRRRGLIVPPGDMERKAVTLGLSVGLLSHIGALVQRWMDHRAAQRMEREAEETSGAIVPLGVVGGATVGSKSAEMASHSGNPTVVSPSTDLVVSSLLSWSNALDSLQKVMSLNENSRVVMQVKEAAMIRCVEAGRWKDTLKVFLSTLPVDSVSLRGATVAVAAAEAPVVSYRALEAVSEAIRSAGNWWGAIYVMDALMRTSTSMTSPPPPPLTSSSASMRRHHGDDDHVNDATRAAAQLAKEATSRIVLPLLHALKDAKRWQEGLTLIDWVKPPSTTTPPPSASSAKQQQPPPRTPRGPDEVTVMPKSKQQHHLDLRFMAVGLAFANASGRDHWLAALRFLSSRGLSFPQLFATSPVPTAAGTATREEMMWAAIRSSTGALKGPMVPWLALIARYQPDRLPEVLSKCLEAPPSSSAPVTTTMRNKITVVEDLMIEEPTTVGRMPAVTTSQLLTRAMGAMVETGRWDLVLKYYRSAPHPGTALVAAWHHWSKQHEEDATIEGSGATSSLQPQDMLKALQVVGASAGDRHVVDSLFQLCRRGGMLHSVLVPWMIQSARTPQEEPASSLEARGQIIRDATLLRALVLLGDHDAARAVLWGSEDRSCFHRYLQDDAKQGATITDANVSAAFTGIVPYMKRHQGEMTEGLPHYVARGVLDAVARCPSLAVPPAPRGGRTNKKSVPALAAASQFPPVAVSVPKALQSMTLNRFLTQQLGGGTLPPLVAVNARTGRRIQLHHQLMDLQCEEGSSASGAGGVMLVRFQSDATSEAAALRVQKEREESLEDCIVYQGEPPVGGSPHSAVVMTATTASPPKTEPLVEVEEAEERPGSPSTLQLSTDAAAATLHPYSAVAVIHKPAGSRWAELFSTYQGRRHGSHVVEAWALSAEENGLVVLWDPHVPRSALRLVATVRWTLLRTEAADVTVSRVTDTNFAAALQLKVLRSMPSLPSPQGGSTTGTAMDALVEVEGTFRLWGDRPTFHDAMERFHREGWVVVGHPHIPPELRSTVFLPASRRTPPNHAPPPSHHPLLEQNDADDDIADLRVDDSMKVQEPLDLPFPLMSVCGVEFWDLGATAATTSGPVPRRVRIDSTPPAFIDAFWAAYTPE